MIEITRTVKIQGHSKSEYDDVVAHIEQTTPPDAGWHIDKDPLLHRVIATKIVEVEKI
jgi:hypothetical protein